MGLQRSPVGTIQIIEVDFNPPLQKMYSFVLQVMIK
jgi:hypothetical protein